MNNPTPRSIRHDFTTYNTDITRLIPTLVDIQLVREAQLSLHQTTVTTAMDELSHNRVINRHPSPITENESQLPRITRTILAQLRLGWANILYSRRVKIIPGNLDCCPFCNQTPHDTVHLFGCIAKPTTLRPKDLWLNPTTVANNNHIN